ncbi:hypothetical protein L226DRAFT_592210 [Lentinus tigrinus ALCF2SS1-7]|uniref:uncharacterized protein n=1 Tax=Lentinus tigrinus ALCF2SS1-7 TaxID=1328758 RepID=UPI0011662177|nr:hypothetical protein L226DRAFT_592210 [Lentinus tigrinus ALCF2SS1-7]
MPPFCKREMPDVARNTRVGIQENNQVRERHPPSDNESGEHVRESDVSPQLADSGRRDERWRVFLQVREYGMEYIDVDAAVESHGREDSERLDDGVTTEVLKGDEEKMRQRRTLKEVLIESLMIVTYMLNMLIQWVDGFLSASESFWQVSLSLRTVSEQSPSKRHRPQHQSLPRTCSWITIGRGKPARESTHVAANAMKMSDGPVPYGLTPTLCSRPPTTRRRNGSRWSIFRHNSGRPSLLSLRLLRRLGKATVVVLWTPQRTMVRTPIRSLSRPSSPFDVDVAQNGLSWRTYIEPLLTRIDKKLYGSDTNLPSVTFGTLGYLKLEGYNARDSAENMCAFVDYVGARSWSEQTVDGSLGTLQIGSHWPSKLSLSISVNQSSIREVSIY